MKPAYFDTSAIIKLYFKENGHNEAVKLFDQCSHRFTAALTYSEVYATFYRAYRNALITKSKLKEIMLSFEEDWKSMNIVESGTQVRSFIPTVFAKVGLRGADATHLSSALMIKELIIDLQFVGCDRQLNVGAKTFGIKIVNPILYVKKTK